MPPLTIPTPNEAPASNWRDTQRIRLNVAPLQRIWDHLLAPLRIAVLSEEASHRVGVSSLKDERVRAVFPFCRGHLLDIGCGKNNLVATYAPRFGVGVDILDWNCGALILKDTSQLPFANRSFDTITFLACLNHIPNRAAVLVEACRVLKDDGQIVLTMPRPWISQVAHKWWELLKLGEDWVREWHREEVYGFTPRAIRQMLGESGFAVAHEAKFLYGFNYLYVAEKRNAQSCS